MEAEGADEHVTGVFRLAPRPSLLLPRRLLLLLPVRLLGKEEEGPRGGRPRPLLLLPRRLLPGLEEEGLDKSTGGGRPALLPLWLLQGSEEGGASDALDTPGGGKLRPSPSTGAEGIALSVLAMPSIVFATASASFRCFFAVRCI